jgi:hypothetical protein
MNGARRVTLSAALLALICFFLPWVQVSCLGVKDSASGPDLARAGDQVLWLVPFLMLVVLLMGLARFLWEQWPAIFALVGTVNGSLGAYLMYRERLKIDHSSGLLATQITPWFWLGMWSSLGVAVAAFIFYVKRSQSP